MNSSQLIAALLLLSAAQALFATEHWTEENTPSNLDLEGLTVARLEPPNSAARSSFFVAGQGGIWRGDQPLAGAWELVHDEATARYRAIVQVSGSQRNQVQAVGDGGRVVSSIDGGPGTWTASTIAGAGDFTGLAVRNDLSNPLLVAVDDGGRIFAGGSVAALSLRHTEPGVVWHDVAFGNNVWVAVGSGATVATSTDGSNWQLHPGELSDGQPAVDFHGVAFGPPFYRGGFFTAVGAEGSISTSTSGTNWTSRQRIPGSPRLLRSVAFVARHAAWVAFGDGGVGQISLDGGNDWSNINRSFNQGMNAVAFGLGSTVVVGDGGRAYTSITRLNPSPPSLPPFPTEGGTATINLINSSDDAKWRATVLDGADFISISPSFGDGNSPSSFTITVDPFGTFDSRSGVVVLNDIPFGIGQTGEGDPLPVASLTATELTDAAIQLEWPPSSDATDYEIRRRELDDPPESYAPVAVVPGVETSVGLLNHVDSNALKSNTTYCYQVVALNGVNRQSTHCYPSGVCIPITVETEFGRADPSPEACATTRLAGAGGFFASVTGELEGISLFWTPVPDASGYQLERRNNDQSGAGFFPLANLPAGSSTHFDTNFIAPGLLYLDSFTYRLTAVGGATGAVPATVNVNTGPRPVIAASVEAVGIDPPVGPLEGAFELSFSHDNFLSAQVESRVEPAGPWTRIDPLTTSNLTQLLDDLSGSTRTRTWRFSQPPSTRSFRLRTATGPLVSSWLELGPVSCPPPPDPTGFTLAGRTANSGSFSWNDVSGEAGYLLIVRPASAIDDSQDVVVRLAPDSTSGSVSSLFPGTSYDAFLVAVGVEGANASSRSTQGVASATLTFSTLPSAPFPVTAIVQGPTFVSVTWGEVPGATGYEIWRSTFFAGGFQPYAFLTAGSTDPRLISDFSVTGGNTYRYQVRAIVGGDFTSFRESNIASTPPAAPSITSTTALSSSEIRVEWSDSNPIVPLGYKLEHSTSSSGPWTSQTVSGGFLNPPPTALTVGGLNADTSYFFRVSAFYVFSNSSDPSPVVGRRTLVELRVLTATTSVVFLTWDAIAGSANYFFERSDNGPGGPYAEIGTIPGNDPGRTFLATGLSPSTSYHFRMRPFITLTSNFGPYTGNVQAVTAPLIPVLSGGFLNLNGAPRAQLTWTTGSASDNTIVQWRPGTTGAFVTIGNSDTTSFAHPDLHPGDNQYQVRASFMGSLSAESNIVTITLNASPEQQWRFDNFGSVNDSGDGADSSDPDGDGFDNAEERANCTDPNDGNDAPQPPPLGSITYVDAGDGPGGNTTFADGSPFTGSTNASSSDGQWRRVSAGINGNYFQSNGSHGISGSEDCPPLRLTIDGLEAGREYECFAYFWSSIGENWRLKASVSTEPPFLSNDGLAFSRSGSPSSIDAPALPLGIDGIDNLGVCYGGTGSPDTSNATWLSSDRFFDAPVLIGDGRQALYQAALGRATADPSGTIPVFIEDFAFASPFTRTAFEGVGYRLVEAALQITHVAFDPATKTVTLRWPDNQVPYEVIGSANLLFGELVDLVFPVSAAAGTVDTASFPGQIQFEFIDPDANGSRRFWRVREQ